MSIPDTSAQQDPRPEPGIQINLFTSELAKLRGHVEQQSRARAS
jgi:hypothetical protein